MRFSFLITPLVLLVIFCQLGNASNHPCPPYNSSFDQQTYKVEKCAVYDMDLELKPDKTVSYSEVEKIKQLLSKYESETEPGFAVGVFQSGKLIFAKGYRLANFDEIPKTSESKFYIGSMAKQFCRVALLKLESKGKIDISQSIQTYLPDFLRYEEKISVNPIIHHTSGISCTSSMQLIA